MPVDRDLKQLTSDLEKINNNLNFALSLGLNKTAERIRKAEQGEIKRAFKNPNRYVLNSIYKVTSNKHDRVIQAKIGIKDQAQDADAPNIFLAPQIEGGSRQQKKLGRGINKLGLISTSKRLSRPDKNKRISKAAAKKVLPSLKSSSDNEKVNSYFLAKISKKLGVYKRQGSTRAKKSWMQKTNQGKNKRYKRRKEINKIIPRDIKLFAPVLDQAQYQKRFKFWQVGNKTIDRHLFNDVSNAIEFSIQTIK